MSKAIDDAVEIAKIVSSQINQGSFSNIRSLRIQAIKQVALNRGVTINAVRHSITSGLDPDIWAIKEFDELLYIWLKNNDKQIIHVLKEHSKSKKDNKTIATLP